MLSQTTEYALRTVVVVARHQNNRVTVRQLAEETAIPQHYLAKVIQLLARARVVNTQRGKGGGITLAQPPAEISVLDIIDVMDPIQPLESCPLKLGARPPGNVLTAW
ncbi:MAG: Rrf2 family transcriptional regulator [Lentisphaeria bacterium]|nr:Rrf2 family transcriptional regulator [Lentisphaeria bacterium]